MYIMCAYVKYRHQILKKKVISWEIRLVKPQLEIKLGKKFSISYGLRGGGKEDGFSEEKKTGIFKSETFAMISPKLKLSKTPKIITPKHYIRNKAYHQIFKTIQNPYFTISTSSFSWYLFSNSFRDCSWKRSWSFLFFNFSSSISNNLNEKNCMQSPNLNLD